MSNTNAEHFLDTHFPKDKPKCKKCGRSGIALNDGICMRCGLPLSDIDKFLIEAIKNKGFYYAGDDYSVKIRPNKHS